MVSVHENPPHRYTVLSEGSRRSLVSAGHETTPAGPPKPRLLDRIRAVLRTRHYSPRTEEAYVAWIRRQPDRGAQRQGRQRSGHDVAGRNEGRSGPASRDRAAAAPTGPRAGCGVGRAPHRAPPEVPECGPRVGVAVGVPRDALLRGPRDGSAAPAPPARVRAPARGEGCRPP